MLQKYILDYYKILQKINLRYKKSISLILVILSIIVIAYYLSSHRQTIEKLKYINFNSAVIIIFLYFLWFVSLMLILRSLLKMINNSRIKIIDNLNINIYSTLVNFFVPGQGGIALRGLYLKKTKQISFRVYILSVLTYYGIYALLSGLMVTVASRQSNIVVITSAMTIVTISVLVIKLFLVSSKVRLSSIKYNLRSISSLLLAVILQLILQTLIFGYELRIIDAKIKLWQIITYSGVTSFSLFASLTPGAIGIRESFLYFSENLHHISTTNILAASLIDRPLFIIFLLILFLLLMFQKSHTTVFKLMTKNKLLK